MKAKKSYGQHFLKEDHIAKKIADALIHTSEYQNILEVGPGKGMLTKFLQQYESFHKKYVEADRDMVEYLNEMYPQISEDIVFNDFLKVNLMELFDGPFAMIGNFPYNISSQIVFRVLKYRDQIPEMVGMFQREVAQRIVAGPNTKEYGILSVLAQAFYDATYLFTVKAGSFNPPPKVQSAVIRLSRRKDFDQLPCSYSTLKTVVKVTFGTRRKMLRNSLKSFLSKEELFADPFYERRPESLSVKEFIELAVRIEQKKAIE